MESFNSINDGDNSYVNVTASSRARAEYKLTSGRDLEITFGNGGFTDVMLVFETGTTFTAGSIEFLDRFGAAVSSAAFGTFSNHETIQVDATDLNKVCAVDTIKCDGITWTGDTEVWIYKII